MNDEQKAQDLLDWLLADKSVRDKIDAEGKIYDDFISGKIDFHTFLETKTPVNMSLDDYIDKIREIWNAVPSIDTKPKNNELA